MERGRVPQHPPHRGLEGRTPLEQWALAGATVRYRDATTDLHLFLFEAKRRVHKDRTVSLHGRLYEADPVLVGENVILRYDPEVPPNRALCVVHDAKPAGLATRLDAYANTAVKRGVYSNAHRTRRPRPRAAALAAQPAKSQGGRLMYLRHFAFTRLLFLAFPRGTPTRIERIVP